ncbi:MAG: RNA polymerase sigma factor [Deltaproteobacteria bacterium]|nr:RNA polymerase sigma factor [Deltaproteobacteria bacterium]
MRRPTGSNGRNRLLVPEREVDELVARARHGEPAAFTRLFRRHRGAVAGVALRILGPSSDLEDVVQEVFLQVFRSLPDFRGQSRFSTWLYRVSINVALMRRRTLSRRPRLTRAEPGLDEPDDHPTPFHGVVRARRLAAFRRLLDRLGDGKRTVFLLHEIEGVALTEIARALGCPTATVGTRLFHARRELARMMRAEPYLAPLLAEPADLHPAPAPASAGA